MEPYEYTVQEPRTIIDEQVISVPKTVMEEQVRRGMAVSYSLHICDVFVQEVIVPVPKEVKIPVLRMVPRTVMVPMMTYVTKHVQENEKVPRFVS